MKNATSSLAIALVALSLVVFAQDEEKKEDETTGGLVKHDELLEMFQELDAEDGVIDGGTTGEELAKEMGFEGLPVDRPVEPPTAPTPTKKRHR